MTSQAIVRFNSYENRPVVFFTDTLSNGEMLAWAGGDDTVPVNLSYYHQGLSMSRMDEEIAIRAAEKALGLNDVELRHRLPRNVKRPVDRLTARAKEVSRLSEDGSVKASQPQNNVEALQALVNVAEEYKRRRASDDPTHVDVPQAIKALRDEIFSKLDAIARTLEKQQEK